MGQENEVVIEVVKNWVKDFVSTSHPSFGNLPPCPFARKAITQQQTQWLVNSTADNSETLKLISQGMHSVENNQYEISVIIHTQVETWSVAELDAFVASWRLNHQNQDLYLMRDHPMDPEIINNIKMNQGEYLIFFIQRKSRLQAARDELKKMGYYDHWNTHEIQSVIDPTGLENR